jgi:hypothetical protein
MYLHTKPQVAINAIQGGQVGPGISPMDNETRKSGVMPAPHGQAIESVAGSKIHRRPGLSRPIMAVMGAIGLVVVLLLASSGFFNVNIQAMEKIDEQASTSGRASQPEFFSQELAGTTVTILGPFFDTSAKLFIQSMLPLEERSGINVVYLSGYKPYETYIAKRLEAKDPPDIVAFPQPKVG